MERVAVGSVVGPCGCLMIMVAISMNSLQKVQNDPHSMFQNSGASDSGMVQKTRSTIFPQRFINRY